VADPAPSRCRPPRGFGWPAANGNWYTNPDTAAGQYLIFSPASGRLAIVPEPSTWVMGAIGAGLVALKARRRKRAMRQRLEPAA
jgi:hypothetical protein